MPVAHVPPCWRPAASICCYGLEDKAVLKLYVVCSGGFQYMISVNMSKSKALLTTQRHGQNYYLNQYRCLRF